LRCHLSRSLHVTHGVQRSSLGSGRASSHAAHGAMRASRSGPCWVSSRGHDGVDFSDLQVWLAAGLDYLINRGSGRADHPPFRSAWDSGRGWSGAALMLVEVAACPTDQLIAVKSIAFGIGRPRALAEDDDRAAPGAAGRRHAVYAGKLGEAGRAVQNAVGSTPRCSEAVAA
jgi:hypothetical protein